MGIFLPTFFGKGSPDSPAAEDFAAADAVRLGTAAAAAMRPPVVARNFLRLLESGEEFSVISGPRVVALVSAHYTQVLRFHIHGLRSGRDGKSRSLGFARDDKRFGVWV